jgi:hypothetical protein
MPVTKVTHELGKYGPNENIIYKKTLNWLLARMKFTRADAVTH